jgi:NADPH:quinone reductase-like Zn-dependent oxidoreductase
MVAAGVGFSDIMAQRGGHPLAPRRLFTPEYDLAGIVEGSGSQVPGLRVGQNVVAINPSLGCYVSSSPRDRSRHRISIVSRDDDRGP